MYQTSLIPSPTLHPPISFKRITIHLDARVPLLFSREPLLWRKGFKLWIYYYQPRVKQYKWIILHTNNQPCLKNWKNVVHSRRYFDDIQIWVVFSCWDRILLSQILMFPAIFQEHNLYYQDVDPKDTSMETMPCLQKIAIPSVRFVF